jgi:hypothetical protein
MSLVAKYSAFCLPKSRCSPRPSPPRSETETLFKGLFFNNLVGVKSSSELRVLSTAGQQVKNNALHGNLNRLHFSNLEPDPNISLPFSMTSL